jgi:hypothetical protein
MVSKLDFIFIAFVIETLGTISMPDSSAPKQQLWCIITIKNSEYKIIRFKGFI